MRLSQFSLGHLAREKEKKSAQITHRSPNPRLENTFSLIDILPTVCAAKDITDVLEFHVLPLVVSTVEDHLVGTGAAFEAVLVDVLFFAGGALRGGDFGYDEHVAA